MSDQQYIGTEIVGNVGILHLKRPEKRNALNFDMMREVLAAAQAFDLDPQVRCLLVLGGDGFFSVGADIQELSTQSYSKLRDTDPFHAWDQFAALGIPKVAAVSGYALGGGCELAMMCDVIIAADDAQFGQPEVKIGCIPGMGGTQRLTRLVGKAVAMDMILTGRMVNAEDALRIGLVSRVVECQVLESCAHDVALEIAAHPRDILRMARASVAFAEESSLHSGLEHERQTYYALYGLPNQKEGMTAFLEKRPPKF